MFNTVLRKRPDPPTIWRVSDPLWEQIAPRKNSDILNQPLTQPTFEQRDINANEGWFKMSGFVVTPLLKIEKPREKPGCPRSDDRRIFDGLIYLARTGSQWCALPAEFGPKSTVYDRFREWVKHGCLQKVWAWLLQQYDQAIGIDWQLACRQMVVLSKHPWEKEE